jgi:hypothetical protein
MAAREPAVGGKADPGQDVATEAFRGWRRRWGGRSALRRRYCPVLDGLDRNAAYAGHLERAAMRPASANFGRVLRPFEQSPARRAADGCGVRCHASRE